MLSETLTETRSFTVQVRQRGQLTIPRKLRDALSIFEGDTLTLLQVGDVMLLSSKTLRTVELADRITGIMEDAGLTLADLLEDLPKVREELYRERYGQS